MAVPPLALPGCDHKCGNVTIPYPFGINQGCFMDSNYQITCDPQNDGTHKPYYSKFTEVLDISLLDAQFILRDLYSSSECFNATGWKTNGSSFGYSVADLPFSFSVSRNKLIGIGCDTVAYLDSNFGGGNANFTSGCISLCDKLDSVRNGSCSGIGCCQTSIPLGLKNFIVTLESKDNHTKIWKDNPCSFAFLGDYESFTFEAWRLSGNSFDRSKIPIVLDWAIGNQTCEEAVRNVTTSACGPNSYCFNSTNGPGYRCNCSYGYEGNPYLSQVGCQGTGAGFLVLSVFIWFLYWAIQRRRKLREKFFQQNGGMLLQQQISSNKGVKDIARIFSVNALKKATNNFHQNQIIGQGGFGTVYKGILSGGKVVAIKKSKIMDKSQIIQFINEVDILSQINHRHVVRLLGCCLETEVPLLVYEFISNGTLFQHIHSGNQAPSLSWENRLRIAAETADALAYLHSSHSIPIFHRDVKSSNILLDDKYKAKVSDFGASRLVPQDQTLKTTIIQGTHGYLDPECLPTGQLTDKSDVYSFGVVLAELLTGKMPLLSEASGERTTLAAYFVSSMKDGNFSRIIDDQILNDGKREQLLIVAELARNCLEDKREDRPTMKEVAKELDSLKMLYEQPSLQQNQEESEPFLGKPWTGSTDSAFEIEIGYSSSTVDELYPDDKLRGETSNWLSMR
ncbi:wall-associated receptor kinase 3-like isoform X2 [Macadamia integrifolia]|uniref:wall-associated receptor kinase 3-like isoform X2 n=1 Tax=Macadamia integrifolia TaxID=60698 RepID=UPI001C4F2CD5|nr:wall-associated receptor kinase 3-like isoform X2 [Macadamia integrifolia]